MARAGTGETMRYGSIEFRYAEPFANALAVDAAFRAWVVGQTKFAPFAGEARLMHEEMLASRGKTSATWWRSHYTEKCRCRGCSGQETDLLAIFEVQKARRFALHVEVKQPADKFPTNRDQAGNYALRAACWVKASPNAVLSHSDAATALLCSAAKLAEYRPHLSKFGTIITFEEVAKAFPEAAFC